MKDYYGTLKVGDKEYKYIFNLNVMQAIQEKYGSVDKWGALSDGNGNKEPKASAVIFGFTEMMNEAIDMENEKNNETNPFLTLKQVGRIITEAGFEKAVKNMNDTIVKSTQTSEKNL